jgi:hypothetical protein
LRDQHTSAFGHRRGQPDALQVAGDLLDRVDRPDPFDLDRHPAIVLVLAHQVDRADVRGPLAPDQAQALAALLGLFGEQLL